MQQTHRWIFVVIRHLKIVLRLIDIPWLSLEDEIVLAGHDLILRHMTSFKRPMSDQPSWIHCSLRSQKIT